MLVRSCMVHFCRSSDNLKCIFFMSYALRYKHSFPTRRSSDLGDDRGGHRAAASSSRARRSRSGALDMTVRSEEHTSELQSRGHLVCRLLLVKNKAHDTALNISSRVVI